MMVTVVNNMPRSTLHWVRAPYPTYVSEDPKKAPAAEVAATEDGLYVIRPEEFHWGTGWVAWRRSVISRMELIGDRFTSLDKARDACAEHWRDLWSR